MTSIAKVPTKTIILLAVMTAIAVAALAVLTVSAQEPRGVISGISVDADTSGQATISWNAVNNAKDYRVVFSPSDEDYKTWSDASGNKFPTTSSVTLTGLTDGQDYKFKVRSRFEEAIDGSLAGPWSDEHAFTATEETAPEPTETPAPTSTSTPEPAVPDAPTGLTASPSFYLVTLTWDDPGDSSITGYRVMRHNKDTDESGVFTDLSSSTGSWCPRPTPTARQNPASATSTK